MLSRFSMAPREGHLDAMKHVFVYLKKFPKGKIIIDSTYRDHSAFKINTFDNWTMFYPDASKELPYNMPLPFGKKACIMVYVNADHAHDTVTRCSVTAILMFINATLVKWYSKC
jgi:hypothetical protein